MWQEVLHLVPSPFVPGGQRLLAVVSTKFAARYAGRMVPPREVVNFLNGQLAGLTRSFFVLKGAEFCESDQLADSSSCCVWPNTKIAACTDQPGPDCQLRVLCLDRRSDFFASVTSLANARQFRESRHLSETLAALRDLEGKLLLEQIGQHPDAFGDLIIFWEVPSNWTVLTRDRSFSFLRERHRGDIDVYHVRLPRILSGAACKVELVQAARRETVAGVLRDYTSLEACVVAPRALAAVNARLTVTSAPIGSRRGRVTRIDPTEIGVEHGIRFSPS